MLRNRRTNRILEQNRCIARRGAPGSLAFGDPGRTLPDPSMTALGPKSRPAFADLLRYDPGLTSPTR